MQENNTHMVQGSMVPTKDKVSEASSDNIQVVNHMYRAGEGIPLVLINAFPVDHRMWDECASMIVRSADENNMQFPIWAPDMPGSGMSPVPQTGQFGSKGGNGSYPQALDAVTEAYAAMLKAEGYDKAVWVGLSMGGYVAADMQRLHPEHVAGIALCDTTASRDADGGAGRLKVADAALEGGTVAPVLHFARPADGDSSVKRSPQFIERMTAWIKEQSPAGVAWRQRMAAGRPDLNDQLPKIDVPALSLGGDCDPSNSPEHVRGMASAMTGTKAESVVINDCGHFSAVEHPDEVAQALIDLMGRVLA